jgi:hypothetical protein
LFGYQEVGNIAGGSVTKLKFYLADVEAFSAPMVVIPDIGGDPNAYFYVKIGYVGEEDFEAARNTAHEVLLLCQMKESDSDIDEEDTQKKKTARR